MKNEILNWLGDVMFDLTDFCESVALKCKEASGHGLNKKLAETEEKDFSECMNEPEVNEEGVFAIRSKKTGKYVVNIDKNGKKILSNEPTLKGQKSIIEDIWYTYHCDYKYYEMIEIKGDKE